MNGARALDPMADGPSRRFEAPDVVSAVARAVHRFTSSMSTSKLSDVTPAMRAAAIARATVP